MNRRTTILILILIIVGAFWAGTLAGRLIERATKPVVVLHYVTIPTVESTGHAPSIWM